MSGESALAVMVSAITACVSVFGTYYVLEIFNDRERAEQYTGTLRALVMQSVSILEDISSIKKDTIKPNLLERERLVSSYEQLKAGGQQHPLNIKHLLQKTPSQVLYFNALDTLFSHGEIKDGAINYIFQELRKYGDLFNSELA